MCEHCGSDEAVELGSLGFKFWMRCRHCGMVFTIDLGAYPHDDSEPMFDPDDLDLEEVL